MLDGFPDDKRRILYAEFEGKRKAAAKQFALTKELKAEEPPFAGKVNVERRGSDSYTNLNGGAAHDAVQAAIFAVDVQPSVRPRCPFLPERCPSSWNGAHFAPY